MITLNIISILFAFVIIMGAIILIKLEKSKTDC